LKQVVYMSLLLPIIITHIIPCMIIFIPLTLSYIIIIKISNKIKDYIRDNKDINRFRFYCILLFLIFILVSMMVTFNF